MRRALTLVLALALAAALVPAIRHLREPPPPDPPVIRTSFTTPPGVELGAGDAVLDAAISGDSSQIAFVAAREGRVQLWRRATDTAAAEPLTGTDGAAMPAWKHGNRVISFFASGRLSQVAASGGNIRELAAAPAPGGAAWQRDGSLLFAPDVSGPIKLLRSAQLVDATRLRPGDRGHAFPMAVDEGGFIYVALRDDGTRVVRMAGSGNETDLTPTSGHAALVAGVLVWARDGVLLAQRLDFERRTLIGRPTAVSPRVGVSVSGRGSFAASPRLLLSAPDGPATREMTWFDARGRRGAPMLEPGDYWQARLSPDDRHVAVTALDPLLRTLDVFAASLDTPGRLARVSLSLGADSDPAWSPDAARLAYRSVQRGSARVLLRAVASSSPSETPLEHTQANDTVTDWRGHGLLVQASSPQTGLDVWMVDTVRGQRTQVTRGAFNESGAAWSPDAARIAYVSDESGQPEVYVAAWRGPEQRVRVSFGGGTRPQWAPDSRTLFFMRGTRIMRTTATIRGADLIFSTPETVVDAPGLIDFSAAHRSDRFAVLTRASGPRGAVADVVSGWTSLVPMPSPR